MFFNVKFVIQNFGYSMSTPLTFSPTGIAHFSFPYYVRGEAGSLNATVETIACTPSLTAPEFIVWLSVGNKERAAFEEIIEKLNDEENPTKISNWEKI